MTVNGFLVIHRCFTVAGKYCNLCDFGRFFFYFDEILKILMKSEIFFCNLVTKIHLFNMSRVYMKIHVGIAAHAGHFLIFFLMFLLAVNQR